MFTQIELLKKYGLSVRGHLGQHLLIDPNMQRKIVDYFNPEPGGRVLEIGPGLGALTGHLLERGVKLTAIEMDERFVEILKKEFGARKNLNLIHEDILKFDFKKLRTKQKKFKKPWRVISNLPYYITAPVLFRLLEYRYLFSDAVFTMQKEVAQRLLASPGTKDYGRLTLAIRYCCDVYYAFDIPPSCFTPQPEVDSSVIKLVLRPKTALHKTTDEKFLFTLIETAFSQRRKTLLHLLARDDRMTAGRGRLIQIFGNLGFPQTVRGEELLLKDFISLAESLKPARV